MAMKKILAILLMVASALQLRSCCHMSLQGIATVGRVAFGGYWELSPVYYPKAVAYFEALKAKYKVLSPISFLISDGPMADHGTIYFPMTWIEELEKGNKFYKEATEWIILHEMGRIAHRDILKQSIALWMIFGGYWGDKVAQQELDSNNYRKMSFNKRGAFLFDKIFDKTDDMLRHCVMISFASIGAGCLGLAYSMATAEYFADDFAMQHCKNPAAWIAAYEWLDRKAPLGWLPGVFHSFTEYRLSRISEAFKIKFGYDLVVVPQSLHPEYVV